MKKNYNYSVKVQKFSFILREAVSNKKSNARE